MKVGNYLYRQIDMNKSTKILVTGGAGFIGSNLVSELNKLGFKKITIVDHLADKPEERKNLRDLDHEFYFDKEDFLKILQKPACPTFDLVFHLGASTNTMGKDASYLIYNNSIYSWILFDFCTKKKIRFIYASSAAVYGSGKDGFSESRMELRPLNLYGYSKYLFDKWVMESEKKPPQWVGLRFFNVYGPGESHKGEMASVVYRGFKQIRSGEALRLFRSYAPGIENGGQKRDFIYIKDVVKVAIFFMNNYSQNGIYNVGTGRSRSFSELARALFNSLGQTLKINFIDMPATLLKQYQDFTEADISCLRAAGYKKDFHSLERGIKDYVQNYAP